MSNWREVSCKPNKALDEVFNKVVQLDLSNMDREEVENVKTILVLSIDELNRMHMKRYEAWETRWLMKCPLDREVVKRESVKVYPHGD